MWFESIIVKEGLILLLIYILLILAYCYWKSTNSHVIYYEQANIFFMNWEKNECQHVTLTNAKCNYPTFGQNYF